MTNYPLLTPLLAVATLIAAIVSGFFIGRVENPAGSVANELNLYPNIETLGVALSGANLPRARN